MEDPIESLEQISYGFDKMDKNNYYMIQQITDIRKARTTKINFNYCLISISKNGGLTLNIIINILCNFLKFNRNM
jgi:hypothetical protein